MRTVLSVVAHSELETEALAQRLTPFLRPGDLIILTGELGAGKTVFVRGLVKGLGLPDDVVNSPSFTIVNEYPGGKFPLFHFDLYRIGDSDELYEVGWNDYLQREGVVVVEWGERADSNLPDHYYQVTIKSIDENSRQIDITFVESAGE